MWILNDRALDIINKVVRWQGQLKYILNLNAILYCIVSALVY